MPSGSQLQTLVACIGLLLAVFELIRRRRLTEEYSFLWLVLGAVLVLVSIRTDFLVLAVSAMIVVCLCLSVIVSRQRQQIERLIEETAILAAELRELRPAPSAK